MGTTSKDAITIISTATVRAPADDHRTVELTPWDLKLLLVGPIQKGLLFHKPKHTTSLVNDLKASLSLTLNLFPPLAGRLSRTDDPATATASFSIDCNNAGAQFLHAAADSISVSDILGPLYVPPVVHSFFPLTGVANKDGVSQPLMAVQVTELADGIFLGCAVNHVVADGTSFWHFLNCWSEISRRGHGGRETTLPPAVVSRRRVSRTRSSRPTPRKRARGGLPASGFGGEDILFRERECRGAESECESGNGNGRSDLVPAGGAGSSVAVGCSEPTCLIGQGRSYTHVGGRS